MLLAQKSYGEGALALELYCARLVDVQRTGDAQAVAGAGAFALITGAGPIGLLTAAVCKAKGLTVAISEPSSLRRSRAAETGVADRILTEGQRIGVIITGGNVDLDRLPWTNGDAQ